MRMGDLGLMRLRGDFRVQLLTLVVLLAGCARATPPGTRAGEQPFDEIRLGRFDSAAPATRSVRALPRSAYRARWFWERRRAAPRPLPPVSKVHPALTALVGVMPGSTPTDVFVTFTDAESIPIFPRLDPARPRGDPANVAKLDSASAFVDSIMSRRMVRYAADSLALAARGATIQQFYWLIQAASITLPLDSLDSVASLPQVIGVRPVAGAPAPADDGERSNDVDAARASLGSDHYVEMGLGRGFMALLDTGVRTKHRLLRNPTPLSMVYDFITQQGTMMGGSTLPPYEPPGGGDTYPEGHGTSSAAILVGNGNAIPPTMPETQGWFRGVALGELDAFQVYRPDRLVSAPATVEGFQKAILRLDEVIIAEMADVSAEAADVGLAADHAFEAGRVVIAPNGNYASSGTGIPARCRRVLGVGAYHLQLRSHVAGQAWGSTDDGRLKPDLLAPSYTETADNTSDDGLHYHSGTSGAAPYAGGAALLARNWMIADGSVIDPGQVYAHMILAGRNVGPFSQLSREGVGLIRLPSTGSSLFGKVWVSDAIKSVDIPIEVTATGSPQLIQAALWWPEPTVLEGENPKDTHNDVDLELVSPGWFGGVKAKSNAANGVFERAEVLVAPNETGRWILRVKPFSMRTPHQVVYWSASVRPN